MIVIFFFVIFCEILSFADVRCPSTTTRLFYKTPFTTHGKGKNGSINRYEIPLLETRLTNACLHLVTPHAGGTLRIDYIMVQPCMCNRMEYKMVFFNGVFKHIANIQEHRGSSKAFSFGNHSRHISFATNALRLLKEKIKGTISDFLVRVDVFESEIIEYFDSAASDFPLDDFKYWVDAEGKYCRFKLVVNEFESIEASFPGKCEIDVDSLIYKYWCVHLYNTLYNVIGLKD